MKETIKTFYKHPLFSGSAIMIIGTNLVNLIAYVYHLVFGRLLGPSLYGDLAVVISIVSFTFSFLSFFSLVIVKFVSASQEKEQKLFYSLFNKKYTLPVLALSVLALIVVPFLSSKLGISLSVLIWIAPGIFFMFLSMIQGAFLQGQLKFTKSVLLNLSGVLLRLFLGLIFYYLGFSLSGISAVIILSYLVTWLLGKKFLGFKVGKIKDGKKLDKSIIKYALPVFIATMGMSAFITIDIILVKSFFDPFHSGLYASFSALGKIVFYGSIPVSFVMFPLVSKKAAKKESTSKLLLLSIGIASIIGLTIILIYRLAPELTVKVLFGDKYIEAASCLVLFSIFSFLFTIDYLIVNYYLAVGRTFVSYIVLFGVVGQIVAIVLLHGSFSGVIWASIIATFGLLVLLILYSVAVNYGLFSNSSHNSLE